MQQRDSGTRIYEEQRPFSFVALGLAVPVVGSTAGPEPGLARRIYLNCSLLLGCTENTYLRRAGKACCLASTAAASSRRSRCADPDPKHCVRCRRPRRLPPRRFPATQGTARQIPDLPITYSGPPLLHRQPRHPTPIHVSVVRTYCSTAPIPALLYFLNRR